MPPHPRLPSFYRAKSVFYQHLREMKRTPLYLKLKLQEGDCVIFQQMRVLHGRTAFTEPEPCSRQLHGSYVNIDAFRNAVLTRCSTASLPIDTLPHFCNGSWR